MQYWGHTYTKKIFIVYLKCKCNWTSCILSGNSVSETPQEGTIGSAWFYFGCFQNHLAVNPGEDGGDCPKEGQIQG